MYREYNPEQGRWWSADPAGLATVNPADPQSWNRYAYVGGTPLSAVDPLGLMTTCPVDPVSGEPVCPGEGPGPGPPGSGVLPDPGGGGGGGCGPATFAYDRGRFAPASGECGGGNGGGGGIIPPSPAPPQVPPKPTPPSVWQRFLGDLPKIVPCPPGPAVGATNSVGANIWAGVELDLFTGHLERTRGVFELSASLRATAGTPQLYVTSSLGVDQLTGSETGMVITIGAGEFGRAQISGGITSDFSFNGLAVGGGATLAATPVQGLLSTPIAAGTVCLLF